ncbi:MAG: hypothetical protein JXA14_00975 [Anaerolineae bacterium]|nr:hypothetical protein [Anaerolineae bacterium]
MKTRYSWFLMLIVAAMLVAACGPGDTTPVPSKEPLVSEGDWHILGPADAAVTIVEYTDFQ